MHCLNIAHRGASGYVTENTLEAFSLALKLKANMIELDIHLVKDKELIVFHDENLERLTDGNGEVKDFTSTQLRKLKIAEQYHIPLLQEALNLIATKCQVNIELKNKGSAKALSSFFNNYLKNSHWNMEDFVVSSFDYGELEILRELDPRFQIAILTESNPLKSIPIAKKINARYINAYFPTLNRNTLNQIHNQNLEVLAWTVNDKADIRLLKTLGVDGIISDYPDRIND